MPQRDARIDKQIASAPPFARPILTRLRKAVHAGCPGVVETLKWSRPSFEYNGLLCGMAAFKAHCTFGFWKDALLRKEKEHAATLESAGCVRELGDLPAKGPFAKALKRAMQLNADGVALPRMKATERKAIAMHPEFAK